MILTCLLIPNIGICRYIVWNCKIKFANASGYLKGKQILINALFHKSWRVTLVLQSHGCDFIVILARMFKTFRRFNFEYHIQPNKCPGLLENCKRRALIRDMGY